MDRFCASCGKKTFTELCPDCITLIYPETPRRPRPPLRRLAEHRARATTRAAMDRRAVGR